MEEFLLSCQRAVKMIHDTASFHVVLGNEACDLDSMVSALVYAYFLFKTAGSDAHVLPVMNIRQSELLLRSDSLHLLTRARLSPQHLLFRDQVDLRELQTQGRLTLTLVDHNVLPSSDADLEGAVVEVIDHHLLERQPSPSCCVTVEMVGSCATLVTGRIIQRAPSILDQQVAELLYVVLDCVNMSPAAGKVTHKDSHVISVLETQFPGLPPRGALFTELQDAKFNVTGLNSEQMLLKDMKVVTGSVKVAVCVLYVTLEEFFQRAGLEVELESFCQKLSCDLLLLMSITFTESKEPIRELAVFSLSHAFRKQISQYLMDARQPELSLRPISSPHPHISAYEQGNTLASRKKLLPLVKSFLKEISYDGEEEEYDERAGPPTPMNSLVDGCPLDHGVRVQDLQDHITRMTSDP
ncbi:exopolyphosphatase PRUNE1 isoform X2 [Gouania willdenowi]|uniref:exopolyphosphatase PRUNE1 isoform X2 n=1 Tax=Gouania willdenowi TaxID=441366 RepID=UPI00105549E6|nr:exopolyphosphatase PRUNE1 isoform X2 [Gouania willdenowi]